MKIGLSHFVNARIDKVGDDFVQFVLDVGSGKSRRIGAGVDKPPKNRGFGINLNPKGGAGVRRRKARRTSHDQTPFQSSPPKRFLTTTP
jgi:hypothetical protein